MPTPKSPTLEELRTTLMECAVIISSFRNRNAQSGYQLREPPGTGAILSVIDALVNTDDTKPEKTDKKKKTVRTSARPMAMPLVDTEAGRQFIQGAINHLSADL